ncbi:uncharacterized protein LOC126738388 [Anthonomus grandis grandis]|uniref:uncharacterized protein LOC126738388 n=1 Tax=Anthonomus grandis grandis TaxID=2921223 RepID=UPI002165117F|nr:uncharacterized protein LOC126738388 [Anthonomus grandis grandis]
MNRAKRSDFKVTLVRNPTKSLSKSQLMDAPSKISSSSKINISSCSNLNKASHNRSEFSIPDMQSALKLSKKIDEVVTIGKKQPSNVRRLQQQAVEERALKNLNIPYNKPLFKNLISLEVDPKDFEIDYKARITPRPKVKPHRCIKVEDSSETGTPSGPSTPKVFLDVPKDVLGYVEEKELYDPNSRLFKMYKVLKIDDANADTVSFNGKSASKSNVYLDLPKDILGFVEEKELYDPCSRSFKTYRVLKIDEACGSERVTFDAKSAADRKRAKCVSESSVELDTNRFYRNLNCLPSESEFRFDTVSTNSRESQISPPLYRQYL